MIILSIAVLYFLIEGLREAWYFHYRNQCKQRPVKGEHIFFTIQRLVFTGTLCWWQQSIPLLFVFALMFPFFHDGAYYYARNLIDDTYPKGFWSNPTIDDRSVFSFSLLFRVIFLLMGIIVFLAHGEVI